MQRCEFGGAEDSRLGHEMFPDEVLVLDQGTFQWLKNDPGFAQGFRKRIPLEQLVVGKSKTPLFAIENG
jgi:hypothetical protein